MRINRKIYFITILWFYFQFYLNSLMDHKFSLSYNCLLVFMDNILKMLINLIFFFWISMLVSFFFFFGTVNFVIFHVIIMYIILLWNNFLLSFWVFFLWSYYQNVCKSITSNIPYNFPLLKMKVPLDLC